jgi:phosphatidylinositol glycan class U
VDSDWTWQTTAADALAAAALCALACGVTRDEGKVRRVYAMYAMNPLHAMARLARTTATATRACAYASALAATLGNDVVAGVAFALAAQLNPHYVALAPALMWTSARAVKSRGGRAVVSAGRFAGRVCGRRRGVLRRDEGTDFPKWWRAAVTFAVMSEDQTPNLGLHWYLFTTMFDQFRLFYVVALNAIPLALSAPLTLGFADDPVVRHDRCDLIAIFDVRAVSDRERFRDVRFPALRRRHGRSWKSAGVRQVPAPSSREVSCTSLC